MGNALLTQKLYSPSTISTKAYFHLNKCEPTGNKENSDNFFLDLSLQFSFTGLVMGKYDLRGQNMNGLKNESGNEGYVVCGKEINLIAGELDDFC